MTSARPHANLHLTPNNHASTPPLNFYRPDALPAAQPTAINLNPKSQCPKHSGQEDEQKIRYVLYYLAGKNNVAWKMEFPRMPQNM